MAINLKEYLLSNDQQTRWNPIVSFFFGVLGAMFFTIIFHVFSPTQKIAVVDITHLIDHFIKTESQKNLPPNELKQEVGVFSKKLETTLAMMARDNHVILLPKEAVIAGNLVDLTPMILNKTQDRH